MEPKMYPQMSQPSQDSIISDDEINYSMNGSRVNEKLPSKMSMSPDVLTRNESIELSDSDDDDIAFVSQSQLVDNENIEERESFLSIQSPDDCLNDKSFEHIFNSSQSMNAEDLVNISIKELCQKEFVSGSIHSSVTKNFARTTSDMTFERHNVIVRDTHKTSDDSYKFSDDDGDEFDRLIKGRHFSSKTELKEDIICSPPLALPTQSNDFVVQSEDQIYQVQTGGLVTPKPDYENMNSPTRLEHLRKYGLKSLTKRKAVICLEHIYNRLHPFIELNCNDAMDNIFNKEKFTMSDSAKRKADNDVSSPEPLSSYMSPRQLNRDNVNDNIVDEHFDHLQENIDLFFLPSAPRAKVKY